MTICKLCGQEKELIKKSHIIPDFMYQDLYDDKHKLILFSPHDYINGQAKQKRASSGDYEGNILCNDCDNKLLGGYEDYAAKAIFGGQLPEDERPILTPYRNQHGVEFSGCRNLNYAKFKLFLLSILWRSSISSRKLFTQINLGPHEEVIRQMILNSNPGDVSDYPIFVMTFVNDKKMPNDVILPPQKRRMSDGHTTYVFPIGGFIYCFYVNSQSHKLPEHVLSETLRPTNELHIIHLPKGTGWDFMLGYLGITKKQKRQN